MNIIKMFSYWIVVTALLVVVLPVIHAEERSTPKTPPTTPDEKPATPELERLEVLIGPWKLVETHFDRAGKTIATVQGSEEITWMLNRHAIRRSYASTTDSGKFSAMGLLTYNTVDKKYQGVWLDNRSTTGPTRVQGVWDSTVHALVSELDSTGSDGQTNRYKVVESFIDSNTRLTTTYRLSGSDVIKLLEVRYTRAAQCPEGLRVFLDDWGVRHSVGSGPGN
ncbi:MAG: DUF1579 family protein [Planctomycetota bacterium]